MSRRTRELTYYGQPGTGPGPETWQPVPADIHTLRFGYNLADVDRLARMSLRRVWGIHLDYPTRYELAWEAVAEHLYAVPDDEPPDPSDLIHAGQDAIAAHVNSEQQQHGYDRGTGGGMPRWAAYWHGQRPVREPEAGLIERLALWQVWPELTPRQRQVFLALAACGTHAAAAESLGISPRTFAHHLEAGRRRFFALWHEHETPPGLWGSGRRVYRAGGPQVTASARKAAKAVRHRNLRRAKARRKPNHGTLREYNFWKCRCRRCTDAKSAESTGRRRRDGAAVRRFMTVSQLAAAVRRHEGGQTWTAIAKSTGYSEGYLRALRSGRATPVPDGPDGTQAARAEGAAA
jgi:hypothetical protein